MAFNNTVDIGSGNYQIVLSDALLGKATKEVFTGVRYKHKASETTFPSSNSYRLQPNGEDPGRFNLSFSNNHEKSAFHGKRIIDESQFILIFDTVKEQFVLHRLDSNFDMMPPSPSSDSQETNSKPQKTTRPKKSTRAGNIACDSSNEASRRKADKPKKTKQPIREPTPEEDDSDDGLTIEYPGGRSQDQNKVNGNPIPSYQRQIRESCERDDDVSYIEDGALDHNFVNSIQTSPLKDPPAEISDEDMEMALEAELEQELLKESAEHTVVDNESDESEEE